MTFHAQQSVSGSFLSHIFERTDEGRLCAYGGFTQANKDFSSNAGFEIERHNLNVGVSRLPNSFFERTRVTVGFACLEPGFQRLCCSDCDHDDLVAFSCKQAAQLLSAMRRAPHGADCGAPGRPRHPPTCLCASGFCHCRSLYAWYCTRDPSW